MKTTTFHYRPSYGAEQITVTIPTKVLDHFANAYGFTSYKNALNNRYAKAETEKAAAHYYANLKFKYDDRVALLNANKNIFDTGVIVYLIMPGEKFERKKMEKLFGDRPWSINSQVYKLSSSIRYFVLAEGKQQYCLCLPGYILPEAVAKFSNPDPLNNHNNLRRTMPMTEVGETGPEQVITKEGKVFDAANYATVPQKLVDLKTTSISEDDLKAIAAKWREAWPILSTLHERIAESQKRIDSAADQIKKSKEHLGIDPGFDAGGFLSHYESGIELSRPTQDFFEGRGAGKAAAVKELLSKQDTQLRAAYVKSDREPIMSGSTNKTLREWIEDNPDTDLAKEVLNNWYPERPFAVKNYTPDNWPADAPPYFSAEGWEYEKQLKRKQFKVLSLVHWFWRQGTDKHMVIANRLAEINGIVKNGN